MLIDEDLIARSAYTAVLQRHGVLALASGAVLSAWRLRLEARTLTEIHEAEGLLMVAMRELDKALSGRMQQC